MSTLSSNPPPQPDMRLPASLAGALKAATATGVRSVHSSAARVPLLLQPEDYAKLKVRH
jgi:hypothetical protein